MSTETEYAARQQLLEKRKKQRQRALWLWRRRVLSFLLLAFATLMALIFIIIGIAVPVEDSAPVNDAADSAETTVAAATLPTPTPTPIPTISAPLGTLSLVNADHGWEEPESETLVSVYENKTDDYNVRDLSIYLEEDVIAPLNQMITDFAATTGNKDLLVCAGYRTPEEQQALWDNGMATKGEEHTRNYIAQPGHTEHATGLALDFAYFDVYKRITYDFNGEGDEQWILEHCWEYGFVQRYPEGKSNITEISTEEWHFRYVGQPHAYLMHKNDYCLEEYLQYLRQFPEDGAHLSVDYDGTSYEIYYCPTEDVPIPEAEDYDLSTDNCGGAVVTIRLS